ncbi:MAG: PDZ domain-containing protein [Planctomycetes bacterium]|nr:PDZ domain-containing protein [Planctomycetota bacterium]
MTLVRRLVVLFLILSSAGSVLGQGISPDSFRDGPKIRQVFRDVIAKAGDSTVRVSVDGKEVAFGTVVDPDGWIISKWSEIESKREKPISVKLKDGRTYTAEIRGVKDDDRANAAYDLVMLKIDATGLAPVEWRHSKEATVGRWVASVGLDRDPIAVGVISVASRKFKPGDQPPRFFNPNGGYLGVQLDVTMIGGAKITIVMAKGPAEQAGLKVNDVIHLAAGRKINDSQSLIETVGRFNAGDKIALRVKRGEEELDMTITLGVRPKEAKMGINPQETMGTKLNLRRGGFPTILQHDSGVRPEHQGGPLVDLDGKAVGINIARAGRTETYAIPSEDIQPLIAELKSGKLMPAKIEIPTNVRGADFKATFTLKDTSKVMSINSNKAQKHFMHIETVKLNAGVTYVIEMTATDKNLDPFLILESAEGKEVARDDDGGGYPNAKIVFRAPADGVYRIICTTFNPGETGSFTLSARPQAETPKGK